MKTVEALISCMVLLSFSSFILLQAPHQDSGTLEQCRLAEDVWRIAYLKGCFNQSAPLEMEFSDPEGIAKELEKGDASGFVAELAPIATAKNDREIVECLNTFLPEVEYQTGLKASFETELQATSGTGLSEGTSITKTVIINGIPTRAAFRVG